MNLFPDPKPLTHLIFTFRLRIIMNVERYLNGERLMDTPIIESIGQEEPIMIGQIDLSELLAELRLV